MATSGCFLLAKIFSLLDSRAVGKGIVKAAAFMGKISLEFYCVQDWIGAMVKPPVQRRFGDLITNVVVFACIPAAALVLYWLCELLKNRLKKKTAV